MTFAGALAPSFQGYVSHGWRNQAPWMGSCGSGKKGDEEKADRSAGGQAPV